MDAIAMPVQARPDPAPVLERVFARIHATRMQGLPFLNPVLRVEAVGFRRWEGRWLGVLITPWFMNLVLLPDDAQAWQHARYGESVAYRLPSGVFEFISAQERRASEELGVDFSDYQSCSLFSPVFEFADQAGARATALAVMQALFEPQTQPGAEGPGTERHGDNTAASAPAREAAEPAQAVSKRDFLRGRWGGERAIELKG